MRFEEAYGAWSKRRLTQEEAAQLLGVCERTFRRYIDRYEEEGLAGLVDKRLEQVSCHRAQVDEVLALAQRPNAVIKVSGACTLSKQPYPFADIWDPLARVFDAWGFERCLWGTDWTRAFAVVNYEQAVEPFRLTDRLSESERAMLMGGACAKAYGWSPTKA